MARVDSLIFFLIGFAQLLLAGQMGGDPFLEILSIFLHGTGGSTLVLGLYFLLFVARHQKEFTASYSKIEKSTLMRNDQTGQLELTDTTPTANKLLWYAGPVGLTLFSALVWISS
ncbi:TPA: hypothetical protein HA325_00040 [Candidatus Thalassarchaeaceae archaeon]|jgi:hypothetical protein|nr:hypothetical protein [Euryarchaeota archaeon]DAC67977.1 MAG TPA: hypothetical protein D7I15_00040 [Candidatus Poseidoniales archaeon]HII42999.1 hypothetical protein [Candidatus Thalassarchaeaceae archaeon]|tara:strand:+ start:8281 stop:8625 length:345 start_codon:yes stop_codon:yes gene_type:complete